VAAMLVIGCGDTAGPGNVIALVVRLPSGGVAIEEEDTTRVEAWTLTQDGDSSTEGIVWGELAPRGVIALDSLTGDIVGVLAEETTEIQARFATLRSDRIPVRVVAAADTITASGLTTDTVPAGDTESMALTVTLLDLTTDPATSQPLLGRPVRFTLLDTAAGVELAEAPDSTAVTMTTGSAGTAAVRVRRRAGQTAADSVRVEADALRAVGSIVPGSPVRFVVFFQ